MNTFCIARLLATVGRWLSHETSSSWFRNELSGEIGEARHSEEGQRGQLRFCHVLDDDSPGLNERAC